MAPPVKVATALDANAVISVLTLAFSADPTLRWVFPDPHSYSTFFPELMRAFAGGAFDRGTAFCTEDYAAAALWLPPEVAPDEEAIVRVLQQGVVAARQEEVFLVLEQMSGYHPSEPHWYLPVIGVDPPLQGRGYGSTLLEHTLRLVDGSRQFAYLESSSPRNIPLYERHGFETVGTIQAGQSPPITPMVRPPR